MAQWSQVQGLPAVCSLYGSHFPLELRHYLAARIEAQPWDKIDPDNESHLSGATQLYEVLVANLQEKILQLAASPTGNQFLLRMQLEESAKNLTEIYRAKPLELVRVVRHCLSREREELAKHADGRPEAQMEGTDQPTDEKSRMLSEFQRLRWCLQDTGNDCGTLQQSQEAFVIQYQEFCKFDALLKQMDEQHKANPAGTSGELAQREQQLQQVTKRKQAVEQQLAREADALVARRQALFEKFKQNLGVLTQLQGFVLSQPLAEWHKNQLRGLHSDQDLTDHLDTLQVWAEHIAEFIWLNRQQIQQLVMLQSQLPLDMRGGSLFSDLLTRLNAMIRELVIQTFVVDKQPPHVLKTQTKFGTSARFLVGGKLNVHMEPPQVTVTIVNETQARFLAAEELSKKSSGLAAQSPCNPGASGEILNNRKVMSFVQASNVLSVAFKNLSLRKIRRGDSKVDQVVTEEKFALLFSSTFSIGGGDMTFCVQRLSLPVVVVVHGNQLPNAEATVLWDNAFAEADRVPFVVPLAVPWRRLSPVLCRYFQSVNRHPLSEANLEYLAVKLLREVVQDDAIVSWQAFNKDYLTGRKNFTFWEWFYGVVELTRKHLVDLWKEGLIVGFMSKAQAQELCQDRPKGTFLLRFSDSEVAAITVAWVGEDEAGVKQVWNLQPWFAKDFTIRSLADRIHDLPQLQYLYPDIPKDSVFKAHYSKEHVGSLANDYVQAGIAAVIPGQQPAQAQAQAAFPLQPGMLGPAGLGLGDLNFAMTDYSIDLIEQDLEMAGVQLRLADIDPSQLLSDNPME